MVFLHSHGVGTARAVRIFKAYGSDAIQVMTENPYIRFGSGACCPVGIYSYAASASETGAISQKVPRLAEASRGNGSNRKGAKGVSTLLGWRVFDCEERCTSTLKKPSPPL